MKKNVYVFMVCICVSVDICIHNIYTPTYICVRRGERERASESNYENKSQNKLMYVIILLITRCKRFYFSLFRYVRKRETRFLWKNRPARDDLEDLAATHEISVFVPDSKRQFL